MKTFRSGIILSILTLLVLSGCDSRPKRVAVSGKVLIDGEPLTYGTVIFLVRLSVRTTSRFWRVRQWVATPLSGMRQKNTRIERYPA
jgi:hypothetical protein